MRLVCVRSCCMSEHCGLGIDLLVHMCLPLPRGPWGSSTPWINHACHPSGHCPWVIWFWSRPSKSGGATKAMGGGISPGFHNLAFIWLALGTMPGTLGVLLSKGICPLTTGEFVPGPTKCELDINCNRGLCQLIHGLSGSTGKLHTESVGLDETSTLPLYKWTFHLLVTWGFRQKHWLQLSTHITPHGFG